MLRVWGILRLMRIEISDDLSTLSVFAEGYEQVGILGFNEPSSQPVHVLTVDKPLLMTDNHLIGQLPSSRRDAVFGLYSSFPRTVSFMGTEVSWSPTEFPRVWCPSIDTVFLAKGLKRFLGEGVRQVAEIGTGSGFLIKFALQHGAAVKRAVATDISIEAIRCAEAAARSLDSRAALALLKIDSDAPNLGLTGRYDLIFTNPPYIPRPGERHDNPYEGRDLLAKLAVEAKELLTDHGRIVTNISSLAGEEPLDWFVSQGWQVVLHETMRVPLKVNAVTSALSPESEEWLSYLLDRGVMIEDADEASGYRFWHDLRLYEIHR